MSGNAEMIFTGDELLRGDAVNTNQTFLGERLLELGILTTRAVCVPDSTSGIVSEIRASLERKPEILVLSGGLGPTEDDLTREAVSAALNAPLRLHEDLLQKINGFFVSRSYSMSEANRKQAFLPEGATAIPFAGTAPGFYISSGDTLVVALPGVPWELEQMWIATVEPLLDGERFKNRSIGHDVRRIRTFGIGESALAELLSGFDWHDEFVTMGTRANLAGVSLILRGRASEAGRARLDETQRQVAALLGEHIYSMRGQTLPEVVGELLRSAGLTVATAESCTGGLVGRLLTDVSGSSDYFMGGVIAYDNSVKIRVLDVPESTLATVGAVSAETAAAMAQGAAKLLSTECALSTTGVAGPGGGTEEKPVGTVFIGSVMDGETEVEELHLFGDRGQIRERSAYAALDLLRRRLQAKSGSSA